MLFINAATIFWPVGHHKKEQQRTSYLTELSRELGRNEECSNESVIILYD